MSNSLLLPWHSLAKIATAGTSDAPVQAAPLREGSAAVAREDRKAVVVVGSTAEAASSVVSGLDTCRR